MCGRYVLVQKTEVLEKRFNIKVPDTLELAPNYNISIGTMAPVIASDKPNELQLFQFGLTPFWAKKRTYFFNARAEGDRNKEDDPNYSGGKDILTKPAFRKPIRSQRCLIPCDCFIEGTTKEGLNKPFVIYLRDRRPFSLAGIWDQWTDEETGEVVKSFAIVTTVANSLLQMLPHHRSPVILRESEEKTWLKSDNLHKITDLLKPYPAELMNAHPISPEIKSPKTNGKELINPVGQRLLSELDYNVTTHSRLQGVGTGKKPTTENPSGKVIGLSNEDIKKATGET